MNNISIIQISIKDLNQLQQIAIQTFAETFTEFNTVKNMEQYVNEALSLSKLTEEINNKNVLFYFAILNDQVIGYLKLNFGEAQTELKYEKTMEIERIYVTKEFHGENIGQLLFKKAIQIAKEKNKDFIWLGVWEKNLRAIRFYEKNGLVAFDKHIFKLGEDIQTDLMMKLQLY